MPPEWPYRALTKMRDVRPVETDRARVGLVEPQDEPRERASAVRGLSCRIFRVFTRDIARGALDWRKTPRPTYRGATLGFRCVRDVSPPPPVAPPEDSR